MIRGTTPTIVFHVQEEVPVSDMQQIWVTFKSTTRDVTYDINQVELDNIQNTIRINMEQEDTLVFKDKLVKVQIRCLTKYGKALATKVMETNMKEILHDGVISGGLDG